MSKLVHIEDVKAKKFYVVKSKTTQIEFDASYSQTVATAHMNHHIQRANVYENAIMYIASIDRPFLLGTYVMYPGTGTVYDMNDLLFYEVSNSFVANTLETVAVERFNNFVPDPQRLFPKWYVKYSNHIKDIYDAQTNQERK